MSNQDPASRAFAVGDRVCIKGFGTANLVHKHDVVTRVTKTMVIVGEYRYRRQDSDLLWSVGRGSHPGGTTLKHTCQHRPSDYKLTKD